MRLTEFIHYVNRMDIGIAANPREEDYTHLMLKNSVKRARYRYQCYLRGKEPVK
jgi:hypothetical protein